MTLHAWERNVVVPERLGEDGRVSAPLVWFPRCSRCGCLTSGAHYRPTPRSEWQATEPPCGGVP